VFEPESRYADAPTYRVVDARGREVAVVETPRRRAPGPPLGTHLMRQGQRVDHLAAHYLGDPAGFWRICDHADVMLPDALREAPEIDIPRPEA
jgi:hypothetical protein